MGENRPDGYHPEPWLKALPGLWRQANRWRRRGVGEILLTGVIVAVAVNIFRLYVFDDMWDDSVLFFGTVLALVAAVPVCIAATTQGSTRLVQWLQCSGIFDALAWDPPEDHPALVWLFREHLPPAAGADADTTEEKLVLIALHLDSLPARGYVMSRFTAWLSQPVGTAVVWAVVLLSAFLYQVRYSYPDDPIVAFAAYFLCLITWALICWRRFRPGVHAASVEQYFRDQHRVVSAEGRRRRDASSRRLQQLIDQLELAFRRGNAALAWTVGYLSVLPVVAWVWLIYQFISQFDFGMMAATVLMIIAVSFIIFVEIPCLAAMWQGRDIVEHLDAQQFLSRAIHQVGPVPEILESVPAPLQGNLAFPRCPGSFTGGVAELLWSIGYNLDWYLKPTPVLIRAGWIAAPLLHAIGAILVASTGGILVFNIEDYLAPGLVVVTMGMIAAMFVIHDIARKFIWTRVFVHHLRRLIG